MRTYRIAYFEDDSGEAPFIQWLSSLRDRKAAALIKARIDRLRFGLFGDTKHLQGEVYELRIHFGPGYRLYYTNSRGDLIILLCGGDKSSQSQDIKKAAAYCTLLKGKDYA